MDNDLDKLLATADKFIAKAPKPIETKVEPVSSGKALALGGGQGITAGFQDEGSALAEKGMVKLNNLLQEYPTLTKVLKIIPATAIPTRLIDQGTKLPEPTYEQARDVYRAENKAAKQSHPYIYGTGEVAGGIAATLPFGAAGNTVKGMSILGAINSAGTSEKQGYDLLVDTALGGATGATLGIVGKAIGAGKKGLRAAADREGLKNLGLDAPTLRRLEVKGDVLKKADEISRGLIDEGILNKPQFANTMEKKAASLLTTTGKSLETAYKAVDNALPEGFISKQTTIDKVTSALKAQNKFLSDDEIKVVADEMSSLMKNLKGIEKNTGYSIESKLKLSDVWDLAKEIDKRTDFYGRSSDPKYLQNADILHKATVVLRDLIDQGATKALPEAADAIRSNSQIYTIASQGQKALANKVRKGVLKNKAIAGQGVMQRVIDSTIGSTPMRGGITGALNLGSKVTPNVPSYIVNPATKAAVIKKSNQGR